MDRSYVPQAWSPRINLYTSINHGNHIPKPPQSNNQHHPRRGRPMFLLRSLRSTTAATAPRRQAMVLGPLARRGFRGSAASSGVTEDLIPDIPYALYRKLSAERNAERNALYDKSLAERNALYDKLHDKYEDAIKIQSRLEVRFTLRSIAGLYLLMLTKICRPTTLTSTMPNSVQKAALTSAAAWVSKSFKSNNTT